MIEIVRAEAAHVDGIVERWIELMDYHAARDSLFARSEDAHVGFGEYLAEAMTKPTALVLVALDGPSVVGYALCMINTLPPVFAKREYGFISDLAVAPAYRKRGIGTALMEKTVDWFLAQGIDRVELRVAAFNEIGISFWRSSGFEEHVYVMDRMIGPKKLPHRA